MTLWRHNLGRLYREANFQQQLESLFELETETKIS